MSPVIPLFGGVFKRPIRRFDAGLGVREISGDGAWITGHQEKPGSSARDDSGARPKSLVSDRDVHRDRRQNAGLTDSAFHNHRDASAYRDLEHDDSANNAAPRSARLLDRFYV